MGLTQHPKFFIFGFVGVAIAISGSTVFVSPDHIAVPLDCHY
ncbi:hypothetical protein SPLC1_S340140 [Arthrospira platensis C1]|nr:hypothetical protein SPLC1_S340140 [Arthrospira platensis C1]